MCWPYSWLLSNSWLTTERRWWPGNFSLTKVLCALKTSFWKEGQPWVLDSVSGLWLSWKVWDKLFDVWICEQMSACQSVFWGLGEYGVYQYSDWGCNLSGCPVLCPIGVSVDKTPKYVHLFSFWYQKKVLLYCRQLCSLLFFCLCKNGMISGVLISRSYMVFNEKEIMSLKVDPLVKQH